MAKKVSDLHKDWINAPAYKAEYDSLRDEYESKAKALREALIAGEDSGPSAPFSSAAFLKRMRAKHTR